MYWERRALARFWACASSLSTRSTCGLPAHHGEADRAVVLLDDVALDLDERLVDVDPRLLERLAVRQDVLPGVEAHHLRAEELAVPVERQPAARLLDRGDDDLRVERLAELDLVRQEQLLDDDLLGEREPDRASSRSGCPRPWPPGRPPPPCRRSRDRPRGGRCGSPRRAAARPGRAGSPARCSSPARRRRLRTGEGRRRAERLGELRVRPERDEPRAVAGLHALERRRGPPVGGLARGEAHAVGHVEHEEDVLPVQPPGELRLGERPGEQQRARPRGSPAPTGPTARSGQTRRPAVWRRQ